MFAFLAWTVWNNINNVLQDIFSRFDQSLLDSNVALKFEYQNAILDVVQRHWTISCVKPLQWWILPSMENVNVDGEIAEMRVGMGVEIMND